MLKACKYCGRIHDSKYRCPKKPQRNTQRERRRRENSSAALYRSSWQWKKKSEQIKERDCYLCQACIKGLGTRLRIRWDTTLEVHHIVPIEEDYELRDQDENLITLCGYHHEEAERGEIPAEQLRRIAIANTKSMGEI